MKSLVVYYSRTGNTRKVAQAIAGVLKADVEEIVDLKDRAGVKGYLLAGRDAMRKEETPIEPIKHDVTAYDLVVVGTPVWAFTMAAPVRSFLVGPGSSARRMAFFCTMGGSGANRAFREMQAAGGREPNATLALTERAVAAGSADQIAAFCAQASGTP